MQILTLTEETKEQILERFRNRSPRQFEEQERAVRQILADVSEKGDEALLAYTEQFDHARLTRETLQVSETEIREAYSLVDPALTEVIRKALKSIRSFHEKQKQNSGISVICTGIMIPKVKKL